MHSRIAEFVPARYGASISSPTLRHTDKIRDGRRDGYLKIAIRRYRSRFNDDEIACGRTARLPPISLSRWDESSSPAAVSRPRFCPRRTFTRLGAIFLLFLLYFFFPFLFFFFFFRFARG